MNAFFKILSENDVGGTGGHQSGPLVPKGAAKHFPELPSRTELNPRKSIEVSWDGADWISYNFIHYNNKIIEGKTRDEYRITSITPSFLRKCGAIVGDILLFERLSETRYRARIIPMSTTDFNTILESGFEISKNVYELDESAIREFDSINDSFKKGDYEIPDTWSKSKVRKGQYHFRQDVIDNFASNCCIPKCSVDNSRFLVAGHIVSWKEDRLNRLNPQNGLSLCPNHHLAFDFGYFTLEDDNDSIRLLSSESGNEEVYPAKELKKIHGRKLRPWIGYRPGSVFIAWHRKNIFLK